MGIICIFRLIKVRDNDDNEVTRCLKKSVNFNVNVIANVNVNVIVNVNEVTRCLKRSGLNGAKVTAWSNLLRGKYTLAGDF